MIPSDTPACQRAEDVAGSILGGDSVATVAIMMVVTAGIMPDTMVAIGVTLAEVTEVQEKTAGKVEADKMVVSEAVMARLPAIDAANPAIWHRIAWPNHPSKDQPHLQKSPDRVVK